MIPNYEKYNLIGIGDFSHGDNNIWEYRLNLLKYFIKNTNKKITIFNEDNDEHSKNIMNIDKRLSYYKSYGIDNNYGFGPLDKYCYRVYDSPIYLNFIKYIRKHYSRINIIGVDPDILERDKLMAKIILKNLNKDHLNLFFGHNSHINNQKINENYETKWHNEKYRCGYYLKQKLKDKYCIILSTGYKGKIRFDCKCNDNYCTNRIAYEKPLFKTFEIKEYKNINSGLCDNFNNLIATFTACDFPNNNPFMVKTKKYDYVLFFKNIKPLKMIKKN